jgi:hypothetical protein
MGFNSAFKGLIIIIIIIIMLCKITNINIFFAAVVDLNGRFFGGRQVKAGFYSWEKLNNLELLD